MNYISLESNTSIWAPPFHQQIKSHIVYLVFESLFPVSGSNGNTSATHTHLQHYISHKSRPSFKADNEVQKGTEEPFHMLFAY